MNHEADLSAEQPGARAPSRVPGAHGDRGRPLGDPRASQPRPQEAVGLIAPSIASPAAPAIAGAEAARIETLTRRPDFLAANGARRAPMPGFVLLVRQRGDGNDRMRVGYTVTKKIGNSVVRNRMKRRLRALARELLPIAGVRGADHVLIGRQGGIERPFDQLRTELAKALAKVNR
jgi:ribonuclease P protein component